MGEIINQGERTVRLQGNYSTGGDPHGFVTFLDVDEFVAPYRSLESSNYVGYAFQVENLLCTYFLPSLDLAPVPALSPEDSMAERHMKVLEINKSFPSKKLQIYSWDVNFNEYLPSWVKKGEVFLQNQDAESYLPLLTPYLTIGDCKLLSTNSKIGFKISEELAINDYVILSADWTQRITYTPLPIEELAQTRNFGFEINTNPTLICPSNLTRGLIWIQNSGTERIYLYWGVSALGLNTDTAVFIEPGGHASYEAARYRLPQPIWAATAQGTSYIQGMEAF